MYLSILAWVATFTVIVAFVASLGFGPVGITAGSAAAVFQAFAYGAFTPAGGIFATLTCLGMTGMLIPLTAAVASVLATIVATFTWFMVPRKQE